MSLQILDLASLDLNSTYGEPAEFLLRVIGIHFLHIHFLFPATGGCPLIRRKLATLFPGGVIAFGYRISKKGESPTFYELAGILLNEIAGPPYSCYRGSASYMTERCLRWMSGFAGDAIERSEASRFPRPSPVGWHAAWFSLELGVRPRLFPFPPAGRKRARAGSVPCCLQG